MNEKDILKIISWSPERFQGYMDARNNISSKIPVIDMDVWSDFNESDKDVRYLIGYHEGQRYMTFKPNMTAPEEDELKRMASQWQGMAAHTEEGDFHVDEGTWIFEKNYNPMEFMKINGEDGWKQWFKNECQWASEDGRLGYGNLLLENIYEPIVSVITNQGNDIWDGWHRVGAGIVKKLIDIPSSMCHNDIPAIIGIRQYTNILHI